MDDYRANPRLWQLSRGVSITGLDGQPVASLSSGGRYAFLGRLVRPDERVAYTRFSLELRTEALEPRRDGRGIVVRATSFDEQRRRIRYWPHRVFDDAPRSQDWRRVGIIVPWNPPVSMMRLDIVNTAASGLLQVRRITVEPLADAAWYPSARIALIAAWIGLAGVTGLTVLRCLRPRLFGGAVTAVTVGLLVAAVLPQPLFDDLATPFEQPLIAAVRGTSAIVPQRPPPAERVAPAPRAPADSDAGSPGSAPVTPERKGAEAAAGEAEPGAAMSAAEAMEIARDGASWLRRQVEGNTMHAAGFGLLALLAVGLARLPFLRVALAVAGVAAATEALQLLTITRDAEISDLAVDATGALLGVLAGFAVRALRAGIRNSARPGPRPAD